MTGLTDIQALTLLQEAPSTFGPVARPHSLRRRSIATFTELALTGAGQSSLELFPRARENSFLIKQMTDSRV